MTSKTVDDPGEPVEPFDVVSLVLSRDDRFVRHAAIAAEGGVAGRVRMTHMRPPFMLGDGPEPVDIVSSVPLRPDERIRIKIFIEELDQEFRAHSISAERGRQYVIHPATVGPCEGKPYRRFNCAGFVVEAYRAADIRLVADNLPAIPLAMLKKAYPEFAEALDRAGTRTALGIVGNGPWPILLAGYVANALNRSPIEIRNGPYRPVDGDERFPSER